MNPIIMPRKMGKTTALIELAAQKQATIVCPRVEDVSWKAQEMGLEIPMPISFFEFTTNRYDSRAVKSFMIDNVDMYLQYLTKVPIEAFTASYPEGDEAKEAVPPRIIDMYPIKPGEAVEEIIDDIESNMENCIAAHRGLIFHA